jgi:hypothetical protein
MSAWSQKRILAAVLIVSSALYLSGPSRLLGQPSGVSIFEGNVQTVDRTNQKVDTSAAEAKCLCPTGVESHESKGCVLLLKNVVVTVSRYHSYVLEVPDEASKQRVAKVADSCSVRCTEKSLLSLRAVQFRVEVNADIGRITTSCRLCSQRNPRLDPIYVSNASSHGHPLQNQAPLTDTPSTIGEKSSSFDFAMFRNVADDDVLWHLIWAPGFFQLLPARSEALKVIQAEWEPSWTIAPVESFSSVMIAPLRKLRRSVSVVKFISLLYRIAFGPRLRLLHGLTEARDGDYSLKALPSDKRPFKDTASNPSRCCSKYIAIGQWYSYQLWNIKMKKNDLRSFRLKPVVGDYVELFSREMTNKIMSYFKIESEPTPFLPAAEGGGGASSILYELRNDNGWDKKWKRWRGVRPQLEDLILHTLREELTLVGGDSAVAPPLEFEETLRLFNSKNLTLEQQFLLIRRSDIILAPEGSFMSWLVFARPGQTWIMVYDHGRGATDFRHTIYHAQLALYRCNVRLIIIEVLKGLVPPTSLWRSYLPRPSFGAAASGNTGFRPPSWWWGEGGVLEVAPDPHQLPVSTPSDLRQANTSSTQRVAKSDLQLFENLHGFNFSMQADNNVDEQQASGAHRTHRGTRNSARTPLGELRCKGGWCATLRKSAANPELCKLKST